MAMAKHQRIFLEAIVCGGDVVFVQQLRTKPPAKKARWEQRQPAVIEVTIDNQYTVAARVVTPATDDIHSGAGI